MPLKGRSAFTLIELLVVIAIIAILAVVVVLTLNPAQLLAQSRDANRVSDMATLQSAVNLYSTDQSGNLQLGTPSTTYVSVPSSASNCSTLGLATSAYPSQCSTSANYRLASSTGWLPVNFNLISAGAPFGSVPVDPVNQTSSNLYYTYQTNGSTYEVTSFIESQKYAKNAFNEGGNDPVLLEAGSGMATLSDAGRGLVGYWPLNEGTGSSTIDWSGKGGGGNWAGTATGTSGYYSPGHVFQWAGAFDGSSDYISLPQIFTATTTSYTIAFWSYRTDTSGYHAAIGQNNWPRLQFNGSVVNMNTFTPDTPAIATLPSNTNTWEFWAVVIGPGSVTFYKNGQSAGTTAGTIFFSSPASTTIGIAATGSSYFQGYLNDLRVYDRALSAAEVLEMYNAEK